MYWVLTPPVVAALLTLALYAITLNGTFIYDDLFVARDDTRLRDPARWGDYWTQQYFTGALDNLYRPLTSMTFAVQAYLFGEWAFPFHLVNWLLAAACSALVADFGRRIAGWWAGLIAGLVFAVHPVHVEVIAGLVGRAEMLCLLATLAGLIVYDSKPLTRRRVALISILFLAALLSKEQGILFPALLGFFAWTRSFVRRPDVTSADAGTPAPEHRSQRRHGLILGLVMIYLAAGYMFYRESILPMAFDRTRLDWAVNPLVHATGSDRWLMLFVILGRYAGLLVWPRTLSIDYGAEVLGSSVRWNEPWFYLGVAVAVAGIALLVWAIRRRDMPVTFSLLAAGLLYGVISNVTLIGTIVAERLMYGPSAFLAILMGIAVVRLTRSRRSLRNVAALGLTALLVLGSIRTVTYAARWNHASVLYATGLQEQPRSVQLHGLVHYRLMQQRRLQEAKVLAESCMHLAPKYWKSYVLLATTEVELLNFERARELLLYARDVLKHDFVVPAWMDLEDRIAEIQDEPSSQPSTQPVDEAR